MGSSGWVEKADGDGAVPSVPSVSSFEYKRKGGEESQIEEDERYNEDGTKVVARVEEMARPMVDCWGASIDSVDSSDSSVVDMSCDSSGVPHPTKRHKPYSSTDHAFFGN